MSNIDIFSDIYVLVQWIGDKKYAFAIISSISLLLTSLFSTMTAYANNRKYLSIFYLFHIGVWIECFDSLFLSKYVLPSFKKLKFSEGLYDAIPQGTIQFYFILTQKSSLFTILSAFQKALSVGWTFSNQIKDTIINNQLFIIESIYRIGNDYNQTQKDEIERMIQRDKLQQQQKFQKKRNMNTTATMNMTIKLGWTNTKKNRNCFGIGHEEFYLDYFWQ